MVGGCAAYESCGWWKNQKICKVSFKLKLELKSELSLAKLIHLIFNESESLIFRMGGCWVGGGWWVVDKTKIMLSQLQTEVELKSELSLTKKD